MGTCKGTLFIYIYINKNCIYKCIHVFLRDIQSDNIFRFFDTYYVQTYLHVYMYMCSVGPPKSFQQGTPSPDLSRIQWPFVPRSLIESRMTAPAACNEMLTPFSSKTYLQRYAQLTCSGHVSPKKWLKGKKLQFALARYMKAGIVVIRNLLQALFFRAGDKSGWKWNVIQLQPRADPSSPGLISNWFSNNSCMNR